MSKLKTLVFIRGWASTPYSFNKFTKTIPIDWNVIMIGADELIEKNDIKKSAENLEKKLQFDKSVSVVLVGHSLGGAVATAYTALYPDRINKLFLINSVGYPDSTSFGTESAKMVWRNSLKIFNQATIKAHEGINLLKRPLFHLKMGRFARKINVTEYAKQVQVPTFILYGDKDRLVSAKTVNQLHQAIPNSQLKVLPQLDHDWIQTQPEYFWQLLDQAG